jgi:phenylpropionate dioxygenase-like ring-hydroxylating dioxygenase large terminal subunit
MLINTWYVAAEATSVTTTPVGVRMLGQDFVVFRDKAGKVHCLSDVCIHRGGSLCRGKVVEGTVQCPYHGWRFDPAGNCVEIPSMGPEAAIPKRARVDAYPAQEKYGWVWVFLGSLPETERPPLPDFFPEYEAFEKGATDWRFVRGTYTFDAAWTRVVENGLDNAHPFFVHQDFGNPDNPRVAQVEIQQREFGSYSTRTQKPVEKRGLWAEKITSDRPDVRTELQFHVSGPSVRIQMHLRPPMSQIIVSAYTPIDDKRTLSWWIQGRNFFTDEKYDADSRRRVLTVFQEDANIVNHIKPVHVPPSLSAELTIYPDAMSFAFRKMIKEHEAKGWRIDSKAMAAEDEVVRAIPSPKRAVDTKNWVLEPVLLRPAAPLSQAAE